MIRRETFGNKLFPEKNGTVATGYNYKNRDRLIQLKKRINTLMVLLTYFS